MRRRTLYGRKNILKRLLIHVGAFNISLVLRKMLGSGKPRELKNRAADLASRLIELLTNLCRHRDEDQSIPGTAQPSRNRSRSITLRFLPQWKMAT